MTLSGTQPYRRDLARDDQVAAGRRLDLVDRDPRRDLLQGHPVRSDREQPVIGDHQIDDALRGHRDRAALDEARSEEHTSELQSLTNLVCRLLLEKKKKK